MKMEFGLKGSFRNGPVVAAAVVEDNTVEGCWNPDSCMVCEVEAWHMRGVSVARHFVLHHTEGSAGILVGSAVEHMVVASHAQLELLVARGMDCTRWA
jgi:hypothetical protein